MITLRKFALHVSKAIPAFAFMLGTLSVSQACVLWFHQPQVPDGIKGNKIQKGGDIHVS